MILQSTKIIIDEDEIKIKIGDGSVIYETDVNSFVENSGVTIQNISFPVKGYYVELKNFSKDFVCGNFIDNLSLEIEKEIDNILIVIDFDEVEDVTESFISSYTKFLLKTSNKIITINMSIDISNAFSSFIKTNIKEKIE